MVEENRGLFRDSLMDDNFKQVLLDGELQTMGGANGKWLEESDLDGEMGLVKWLDGG